MSAVLSSEQFTLTADQQNALDAFQQFLVDPTETVFVLSGYSGCGKSTLVRTLLDQLPKFQKMVKLLSPNSPELEPVLTATTNKAAENLGHITGMDVRTIHSYLGLRVTNDFKNNTSTLTIGRNAVPAEEVLLFIDEASYIDKQLLQLIFQQTRNSKIVFVGDPAQLTPVHSPNTPVFQGKFPGAALNQVVRQAAGNPIVDLSARFREAVNTGQFFSFKPDGHFIRHLSRQDFTAAIEAEFTRPDWRYRDSKILGWTNKCVVGWNHFVRNVAKGDPHFQPGDYAVCNSFVTIGRSTIKTDQLVEITDIDDDVVHYGVLGNWMRIDQGGRGFQPKNHADKQRRLKEARAKDEFGLVAEIETSWLDLRAAYACTINKAQGSTFESVFIDLDDIARCNSGDQIARMMYVAVSRARNHVYLCGDLA